MPEAQPIPDIRDIPPPPEVAEPIAWWIWLVAGGALAVLSGLCFLWHWYANRPSRPTPPRDPREVSIEQLHRLSEEADETPAGALADGVAKAIRHLLAARLGETSLALSTAELAEAHGDELRQHLGADRLKEMGRILTDCDRLRFAPAPNDSSLRSPLVDDALSFVRELPPPPPADADPAAA